MKRWTRDSEIIILVIWDIDQGPTDRFHSYSTSNHIMFWKRYPLYFIITLKLKTFYQLKSRKSLFCVDWGFGITLVYSRTCFYVI